MVGRGGMAQASAQWLYALHTIAAVCDAAVDAHYVEHARLDLEDAGILAALPANDTAPLFNWLAVLISFQGISDEVALSYIQRHGSARHQEIAANLLARPPCQKLSSYWQFHECGYHKGSRTCSQPEHIHFCPLPTHRLRNGRLNQTAYSLFLFIRDVAGGDLIGWIDSRLGRHEISRSDCTNLRSVAEDGALMARREALLEPLSHVYGVSRKVLNMCFSHLLIGAGHLKPEWMDVGPTMVAVDTLVHNFLHRTGILGRLGIEHSYGSACYNNGCADLIRRVAAEIDARQYNAALPRYFPRLVQHAIWRYCASSEINMCNGNNIDDLHRCQNSACQFFAACDRVVLKYSAR
jgi:hypothetical protein